LTLLSQQGDTVSNNHYLIQNRFGIYSYRVITPQAVRRLFPAFKTEVRLSTRTRSVRQANRIAAYFHHRFQSFFESINRQGCIMDNWLDDDLIADDWLTDDLAVSEHIKTAKRNNLLMLLIERNKEITNLLSLYNELIGEAVSLNDFKLNTPDDIETFSAVAKILGNEDVSDPVLYLKKLKLRPANQRKADQEEYLASVHTGNIQVNKQPENLDPEKANSVSEYKQLNRFSSDEIHRMVVKVLSDHHSGKSSSFIIDKDGSEIVIDDLSIDSPDDIVALMAQLELYTSQSKQSTNEKTTKPDYTIRVSRLTELYLAQRLKNLSAKQNRDHSRSAAELLKEYFNDDPWVHEISREDALELVMVLGQLPVQRNVRAATKHLSLKELLERDWPKVLGYQGQQKYLTEWHQLFKYAVEMGYATDNVMKGVSLVKKYRKKEKEKADKETRRFPQHHIDEMFSVPIFTGNATRSYYFWVPLLCLYTGARVNEIAQLDVDDVYKEQGIWCIHINDKDDKSVKTESSIRLIPIHQHLIDLGFVRYVSAIKAARQDPVNRVYKTPKLWWDIYQVNGKYSNACNKAMLQIFKHLSFKTKGDKYHGLRHSLVYILKNAGVDESTYGAILGHSVKMRSGGLYGDRPTLKRLKAVLDGVSPLSEDIREKIKPYRLPRTLLPQSQISRFNRKKYLVDLTKEITDSRLLEKIHSW
jgi:site-specific recombinase XerD